jgi:low molecular weight phosphotyrosine protein phosphatase
LVKKGNYQDQFHIDSAAIGPWHVGKKPDRRALETMKKHNLEYDNKARCLTKQDFKKYHYIFGMDYENMTDLEDMKPSDGSAKLLLLGDFDPQGEKIIRDPYYDSNSDGFEKAFVQAVRCCESFLKKALAGEV